MTRYERLRAAVVDAHDLDTPECRWCGETDVDALVIDHIHGGGCEERRRVNGNNGRLLSHYRRQYPDPDDLRDHLRDHLQILCANCHLRKLRRGYRDKLDT